MRSKILVVLIAVAVPGASSTAMARGGGGGWSHGGMHGGMFMHGHGQFGPHFHFVNRFNRGLLNRGLLNSVNGWGWGLGGDWGWGAYGNSGYGNTTVVAFPQAALAGVTGSISTGPCQWKTDTFTVPSSAGGTRPVEVVSCR
jgi:hypothetical protein